MTKHGRFVAHLLNAAVNPRKICFASRARAKYYQFMSYLTVEVEIDHGRFVAAEPEKLPDNGKGLLTVLEGAQDAQKMTRLEAFHALQKSLNLDDAKAKALMDMIRDARR